ncbi:MAG TPA: fused MFS/spermidine synthase [Streptosporangiaceae bacterium]
MSDQPGAAVVADTVRLVGDPGRPAGWTLLTGGFPQSHVDLDDPRYLEFEYVRRLGHLADLTAPAGRPLRVLHLGGGALTLARYVAATRPGSPQLAVDCDAGVVEAVRARLPLAQPGRRTGAAGRIRIQVADARAVLERARPGSFDLVVADVFAGGRTPAHLTSEEFTRAADRALAPGGLFAVNIGDGPPLAHARARVAAVRAVFTHVCLIADPGVLRGRRFGNLVAAGSRRDLPVAGLVRLAAGDPFPGRVVTGAELDRFVAGARPMTDASAEASPPPPADLFSGSRTSRRTT